MKQQVQHRTPLSKVRGLGSAKSARSISPSRADRIANVPLAIAFVINLTSLLGRFARFLRHRDEEPLRRRPAAAVRPFGDAAHEAGMQVIIEDYVHEETPKIALLILNTFFAILIAAACGFAILKMAFGG